MISRNARELEFKTVECRENGKWLKYICNFCWHPPWMPQTLSLLFSCRFSLPIWPLFTPSRCQKTRKEIWKEIAPNFRTDWMDWRRRGKRKAHPSISPWCWKQNFVTSLRPSSSCAVTIVWLKGFRQVAWMLQASSGSCCTKQQEQNSPKLAKAF